MVSPEKIFKFGAVRASVFKNMIELKGQLVPLLKVVVQVRYRDKNGQWKGTNSLSVNDLPKAIAALQRAYEYILVKSSSQETQQTTAPEPPQK